MGLKLEQVKHSMMAECNYCHLLLVGTENGVAFLQSNLEIHAEDISKVYT